MSLHSAFLSLGHNKVNQRLRYEEITNDPAWPKVPFPNKDQCNSCVEQVDENGDAKEYNENETYKYLKTYYYLHGTSRQKNSAMSSRSNRFVLGLIFTSLLFVI